MFALAPQDAPQPQMATAAPIPSFEPPMQAAPIFASPRKQLELSKLMAAFKGPNFFAKG
jgi:hypothetical protein